jgi:hypothetical protein
MSQYFELPMRFTLSANLKVRGGGGCKVYFEHLAGPCNVMNHDVFRKQAPVTRGFVWGA